MSRKRNGDMGSDLSDLFDGSMDTSDLPKSQIAYESIQIAETEQKIEEQSKSLIKSIADLYFKTDIIDDKQYAETIQQIESMNLKGLMLQVKYGQHMLKTLMTRLDGGEYVENGIYRLIMDVQNNLLRQTITISQYIRNLPSYFKHAQKELIDAQAATSPILNASSQQANAMIANAVPNGEMSITVPHRGMRDLLKNVEQMMEIEKAEDIDSIPYEDINKKETT